MPSNSSPTSKDGASDPRRTSELGTHVSDMRGGFRLLRRCRRPGCGSATTSTSCGKCWRLLSHRTRRDILASRSRLTTDPKDEHAYQCHAVAWKVASREWTALDTAEVQRCP
jgi:hypothetical protein